MDVDVMAKIYFYKKYRIWEYYYEEGAVNSVSVNWNGERRKLLLISFFYFRFFLKSFL